MSEAAEKLKTALLELSIAERLEIANFLYASIPPRPGALCEDDPGFDEELERRRKEHESGANPGIPAEEVLERLRKKYTK